MRLKASAAGWWGLSTAGRRQGALGGSWCCPLIPAPPAPRHLQPTSDADTQTHPSALPHRAKHPQECTAPSTHKHPSGQTFVRQARPLVPSMFMAHEPQMPSRQDRLRLSVWSCSSLTFSSTSSIMGPHLPGGEGGVAPRQAGG